MTIRMAILVAMVSLVAAPVFAAGYGDAGCGLGSMIFGGTPNVMGQTSASTTNQSTSTQAFGISSGTSNCDATGIVLAEKAPEVFVERNFASLAKDMAAGQGENLVALAGLLGCSGAGSRLLGQYAQEHYGTMISDQATPLQTLEAVRAGITGDPVLSVSCRN